MQPFHVAAFIKQLPGEFSAPTVKHGPKYLVKKGKPLVLDASEERALLDAIPTDTPTGLRSRRYSTSI